MILGIGTDIVEVDRIASAVQQHGARFAQRILTDREYTTFADHSRPSHFLAKRFAAKECIDLRLQLFEIARAGRRCGLSQCIQRIGRLQNGNQFRPQGFGNEMIFKRS